MAVYGFKLLPVIPWRVIDLLCCNLYQCGCEALELRTRAQ